MATTTIIRPCAMSGSLTAAAWDSKPNLWFDYEIQVWVRRDIVQPCGHTDHIGPCCAAARFAGTFIWEARKLAGLCGCDSCCAMQWAKQ